MALKKFIPLCLLLSVFAFFPVAAQAEESAIKTLSKELHAQLDSLKQQSRHLTEQLLIAENELQTSSKRVEELQTELSELSTCLTSTNEKLSDYSTKLTEYETKLKVRAKVIIWAMVMLVIFVAVRVVLLILMNRGVKLPYLLNLLL